MFEDRLSPIQVTQLSESGINSCNLVTENRLMVFFHAQLKQEHVFGHLINQISLLSNVSQLLLNRVKPTIDIWQTDSSPWDWYVENG